MSVPGVAAFHQGGGSGGGGVEQGPGTAIADNKAVRGDTSGIQGSGITIADNNAFSGNLLDVGALDDNYTLAASDSGRAFNIRNVGGAATITLDAAPTAGFFFEVAVVTTDEVTIQFVGSQVCQLGAAATSAGGTLKSSTKGSKIRVSLEAPNLFVTLASGTWTAA